MAQTAQADAEERIRVLEERVHKGTVLLTKLNRFLDSCKAELADERQNSAQYLQQLLNFKDALLKDLKF